MGNENCFELAGGSEYRGLELPGVDCKYFVANFFYAVFFFFLTTREISQKCQKKQYYSFIPRINLLNLRYFVAEVRRLFPVNRQYKRESGKQRNTVPS